MSDQDLFEGNDDIPPAEPPTGDIPPGDNDELVVDQLLKSIVNEDGEPKYKTPEEAIKANAHAQKHIKQLEADLAELKEKGNASDKLDELLEAVKQSKGSGTGDIDTSAMKPEDVLTIVKEFFTESKTAEIRESNINTVVSTYKQRYGKDASKELYGKADDLGFSKTEINKLIANNPTAALNVLGVKPIEYKPDVISNTGHYDTAHFRQAPDEKPKSIMGVSSSKELVDAWHAQQKKTLERLGVTLDKK